jgi:outer membrane protein W
MKKIMIAIATLIATAAIIKPAHSQESNQNNVGLMGKFGTNGSVGFEIISRFKIADYLSIHPAVFFQPSSHSTTFGAAVTYDFNLAGSSSNLSPHAGLGFQYDVSNNNRSNSSAVYAYIGADYNLSDSLVLKGDVSFPIFSTDYFAAVGIGAGLRF